MPIDYAIDHARQLVIARGRGTFTGAEVFAYQREVWSRLDVLGYDELVDMTAVEKIVTTVPAGRGIRQLASEAASQDDRTRTAKFAIVAPDSLSFGLGREYQAYRELALSGTKEVGVFHTLPEALAFLGIAVLDEPQQFRTVERG